MSYQIGNSVHSFIQTARRQRGQPFMANTLRSTSLYAPPTYYNNDNQSEFNYTNRPSHNPMVPRGLRSLSPEDVQKMKYKIELDKQVAEKQNRIAREWEKNIERDRKYVRHQSFGRHDRTTVLKPEELEELVTKGRAPSPILEMPQQHPFHYQQQIQQQQQQQQQQQPYMAEPYIPNDNSTLNMYNSPRQPMYNNYPQFPTYQPVQPVQSVEPVQPQLQSQPSNYSLTNNQPDFQRFYGPSGNPHSNSIPSASIVGSAAASVNATATAQPLKGDAHDPFLQFDPNKEGQNVFNIIPQQDLYDPWGRPGAGAPLIHAPTGQKFTRYSGSLQDKLNHVGPLGFHGRQPSGNIDEQKRELELEQRRRQQEDMEHRANAGDTAEWIAHLETSRYPLKLHLATTEATREAANARTRYRSQESRTLHNDLVRQAEERARLQKLDRYHGSMAELQHSEAMNNWWGRSGGGAPLYTSRRHNVSNAFENPKQTWTTNHLGQLMLADDEGPSQIKIQSTEGYYPRQRQLSNHRNYYEMKEDEA